MVFDTESDEANEDAYDADESPPLKLDLDELGRQASRVFSRPCIRIQKVKRGRYHEIFALYFSQNGQLSGAIEQPSKLQCLARFSLQFEASEKLESELATMQYVRAKTSIPVPEVYYWDFYRYNRVGAQYMLIGNIAGRHLYEMWSDLSLDHKKIVIEDIVKVLTQLSSLKFDAIGSMTKDGVIGPLLYRMPAGHYQEEIGMSNRPFSSTLEYLQFFRKLRSDGSDIFAKVEDILNSHLSSASASSCLDLPFQIIHGDFDAQNLLFTEGLRRSDVNGRSEIVPPRLSGVIDWEYASTGPTYYLYEYPIFIQDSDDNKPAYAENAILRRHFLCTLIHSFPKGSRERAEVRSSMNKTYVLNWFHDVFVEMGGLPKVDWPRLAAEFVDEVGDGTGQPYQGRIDYEPDEDVRSDD